MSEDNEGQNPFEEGEAVEEEEMICWKDSTRVCGPDCVAFDERSIGQSTLTSCWLINLGRSAAKNLSTLADGVVGISKQLSRQNDFYDKDRDKAASRENRRRAAELKAEIERQDSPPPEVNT